MQQGDKITLTITGLNNEGEGVARVGGEHFVLFVPDALPGEEVTCRIVRLKKNYGMCKALERSNSSAERTAPRCRAFGRCGGCQLQHISYKAQLDMKRRSVYDALSRIGGVEKPHVFDCQPSPSQWGYRNKASMPVQCAPSNIFNAGFYKTRSHDIVPFAECPVLLKEMESSISNFINAMRANNFHGFNESEKQHVTNYIRHIIFRRAKFTGESLCGAAGYHFPDKNETEQLKKIASSLDGLNGLVFNKNTSEGNFIWGDKFEQIYGSSLMREQLGAFTFSFGISSFFQINSAQALNLYTYASKLAADASAENVLELYSGTGTLTTFLASGAKNVTAVESWKPAAEFIEINARHNGMANITSRAGLAEDAASELSERKFDTVVLDPPRTGCAASVVSSILKISPKTIIYVSCNPATLARDVKLFAEGGYNFVSAKPFDMFPQTGSVETAVLLTK